MSADQTQQIDALDTAELELTQLPEPPAGDFDVEPGRPSWEPENGDFS